MEAQLSLTVAFSSSGLISQDSFNNSFAIALQNCQFPYSCLTSDGILQVHLGFLLQHSIKSKGFLWDTCSISLNNISFKQFQAVFMLDLFTQVLSKYYKVFLFNEGLQLYCMHVT